MKTLQRLLIALPVGALSVWLYTTIWYMTGPMAHNIESATEAGVDDTVIQTSWLRLWALLIALVISLQLVWMLDPTKFAKRFSRRDVFLIFVLPMATTSLTPLIGAYAGIFAALICILGTAVRADMLNGRKRIA
jgi:hypothetical protein